MKTCYNSLVRDVAQLGSALPWGGRGRQFKSGRSDQSKIMSLIQYMSQAFSFKNLTLFLS